MIKKIKHWWNNLTLKQVEITMWVVGIIMVIVFLIMEIKLFNSSRFIRSFPFVKCCIVFLPFLIVAYVELKLYFEVLENKLDRLYKSFRRIKKNESVEVYLRQKLRRKVKEQNTVYFLTKKEGGFFVLCKKSGKSIKLDSTIQKEKDFRLFDDRFIFTKEEV